jgi:hypothetical protein
VAKVWDEEEKRRVQLRASRYTELHGIQKLKYAGSLVWLVFTLL